MNKLTKNKIVLIYIILAIVFIGILVLYHNHKSQIIKSSFREIEINGKSYKVEVVENEDSRQKGLGGRKSLPEKEGMLFVFPLPDIYEFWMKGMKFSLDFIWIDDDKITEITKNIPYGGDNSLKIYTPKKPVNMVLEVNAGFSDEEKVKVGDSINIK